MPNDSEYIVGAENKAWLCSGVNVFPKQYHVSLEKVACCHLVFKTEKQGYNYCPRTINSLKKNIQYSILNLFCLRAHDGMWVLMAYAFHASNWLLVWSRDFEWGVFELTVVGQEKKRTSRSSRSGLKCVVIVLRFKYGKFSSNTFYLCGLNGYPYINAIATLIFLHLNRIPTSDFC